MTDAHATRAHASLAPSSIARIIKCPGSKRLSAGIQQAHSPFAAEGTAAHMLAENCLATDMDAFAHLGRTIDTKTDIGTKHSKEKSDGITTFEVDHEMVDSVQLYLDVCRELKAESDEFAVEQRLDMGDIAADHFGTGDVIAYSEAKKRVTIVDLKYGKGVAVDVAENEQELSYALGVARRYHNRGVEEVELVIVQPRAPHVDGPVRRWTTDVVGLYEHAFAVKKAAIESESDNPRFAVGEHCKFCRGVPACDTLYRHVLKVTGAVINKQGEITSMSDPQGYVPAAFARALKQVPIVVNWTRSMQQHGHAEAMRGNMPDGFKFVSGRPTRKWKDPDTTVKTLQTLGVADDDIFESSLRSPAQIEKLSRDLKPVVKDLAVSKSSKINLAPIDDPRESVDPNDASGFDAVEIGERE